MFIRLAEYLCSNYSVFVADYSDGYMARNLPSGVELIRVDKGDKFPEDSVFVFQSFLPWRFPYLYRVDPKSRVIFWSLHPKNFDPSIFNANSNFSLWATIAKLTNLLAKTRRAKVRKLIKYLLDNHALAIMDRENQRTTEQFIGVNIGLQEYLPVASPALPILKGFFREGNEVITCAWIGRLADFKYSILEHLFHRLSSISSLFPRLRLVVIGEGEYAAYLKKVAEPLNSEKFDIEFVGELPSPQLHCYLIDNVDIVFAMGTSALEAASLRIPVFLTDYSYSEIRKNYRFSLLYENSGYCLGEEIIQSHYELVSSLDESIKAVMTDYDLYAERCYEYWNDNFSLESVSHKFIHRCELTTATFATMKGESFFESDRLGKYLRFLGWMLRGRYSREAIGFRYDC